ncbi:VTT domain-containing protein [Streptantibioticus parmotrematis]|uniref:TVP38/TMEM64 family protein n=1 Tax=Streptantibioticus parmotrematis TaxID=2873249 RepID=UPI0033CDAA04
MPVAVALPPSRVRVRAHALVRLGLLVALLAAASVAVLIWHPQRLLGAGGPVRLVCFTVVYAVCTVAFAPRPLLNLAAGVMLGTEAGTVAAVAGTVLGAGAAFCLGRLLGREALRPLLRGRLLLGADRQLSEHGLRSTLAMRLLPGVPFAAANYCAAFSRMRCVPFLVGTALGSVPNTMAYVVAGSRAASPGSPAFLIALAVIAVPALLALPAARSARVRAWLARARR